MWFETESVGAEVILFDIIGANFLKITLNIINE